MFLFCPSVGLGVTGIGVPPGSMALKGGGKAASNRERGCCRPSWGPSGTQLQTDPEEMVRLRVKVKVKVKVKGKGKISCGGILQYDHAWLPPNSTVVACSGMRLLQV